MLAAWASFTIPEFSHGPRGNSPHLASWIPYLTFSSSDYKTIGIGTTDGESLVYDLESQTMIQHKTTHEMVVNGVAFDEEDQLLISVSVDGTYNSIDTTGEGGKSDGRACIGNLLVQWKKVMILLLIACITILVVSYFVVKPLWGRKTKMCSYKIKWYPIDLNSVREWLVNN